jgi:hypothetical protein
MGLSRGVDMVTGIALRLRFLNYQSQPKLFKCFYKSIPTVGVSSRTHPSVRTLVGHTLGSVKRTLGPGFTVCSPH